MDGIKKRGRKPKEVNENIDTKVPKKRGRKPKEKTAVINTSNIADDNSIILHLPIKSDVLLSNASMESLFLNYNPEIGEPLPFEEENNYEKMVKLTTEEKGDDSEKKNLVNYFFEENKEDEPLCDKNIDEQMTEHIRQIRFPDMMTNTTKEFESPGIPQGNKRIHNVLDIFHDCNKKEKWPMHTNFACWWCCHTFDTIPLGIPESINDDKINLYGNMCSFPCMYAWMCNDTKNGYRLKERYSLMIYLYRKIYGIEDYNENIMIKQAGPREVLKMFGGTLDINQYRRLSVKSEFYVNIPVLASIIPSIEEYGNSTILSTATSKNVVQDDKKINIPVDEERINKAYASIKNRKTKAISSNSLTKKMGLNIS